MKLKMVTYPNELLRKKSEPVTEFNDEIKELAQAMLSSLEEFRGVGLSAVQIGRLIRLFVVDTRQPRERGVFINPQIIGTSQDNVPYDEGCLSIPEFFARVMRPSEITVQAYDVNGKPFVINAKGLYARAIQHEADHLEGKLFVDHLEESYRRALLKDYSRACDKKKAHKPKRNR